MDKDKIQTSAEYNESARQAIISDLREMEKVLRLQLMKCNAHEKLARTMYGEHWQDYANGVMAFKECLKDELEAVKRNLKEAEEAVSLAFHESYY